MLAFWPEKQLSSQSISSPAFIKRLERCENKKPTPPEIKLFAAAAAAYEYYQLCINHRQLNLVWRTVSLHHLSRKVYSDHFHV